ncbi:MAG TPA: hypothetical protein VNQ33_07910, partial [Acidimicrobiales bacterium]|nr:hypothetical protein [Acidimicrobiales bacterium]
GTHTLERYRSQMLIQWRSFDVDVELHHHAGDTGVLFSHGDQGGGYSLFIDDGDELVFAHNGYGVMTVLSGGTVPDGTEHIRLSVEAPGNWLWSASLAVDGQDRARAEGLVMLGAISPFEGINVGIDRRSPVSWDVHERHGTFPYSGLLDAVTYTPGERAPDAGTNFIDLLREIGLAYE